MILGLASPVLSSRAMRRRLLLPVLALLASLTLVASGCLSPTLPLPPPDVPSTITAGAAGTWDVFGACTPGARVTVFNERTGAGVVIEDRAGSGRYHVMIAGAQCDVAWVIEEVDSDRSAPTTFVLAPRGPGEPADSPLCH